MLISKQFSANEQSLRVTIGETNSRFREFIGDAHILYKVEIMQWRLSQIQKVFSKKKKINQKSHMPCIPVLTVIVFSHLNKLDLYIRIHNLNSFHAQYVNIHIFLSIPFSNLYSLTPSAHHKRHLELCYLSSVPPTIPHCSNGFQT